MALRSKAWVCGRSPAGIMGSNPAEGMHVCCECCVLSGGCLCDELITRPEESSRVWCVVVWDQQSFWTRRPWVALGRSATWGGLYLARSTNLTAQPCAVFSGYFISLRPRYLPKHPVLAQPQKSTFYTLQILPCALCYYPSLMRKIHRPLFDWPWPWRFAEESQTVLFLSQEPHTPVLVQLSPEPSCITQKIQTNPSDNVHNFQKSGNEFTRNTFPLLSVYPDTLSLPSALPFLYTVAYLTTLSAQSVFSPIMGSFVDSEGWRKTQLWPNLLYEDQRLLVYDAV